MSPLHVVDDAASSTHLNRLRDVSTTPSDFHRHARQLGSHLALAALADLPTRTATIQTPLGPAAAREPAIPVIAVPILRAGLGLLAGVQEVLPSAVVGMIGLERDEETLLAREYYRKVPEITGAWVLVLEPMLATGGSAAAAVASLAPHGPTRTTVVSVVATQVAIDAIAQADPNAHVVTAALDPGLDDHGFIVPGLGDFGDRLFGTL